VLSPYWMRAINALYGSQPAQVQAVNHTMKAGE